MNDKKERDALKSYAYNLARTKTTVDNYGKELVSGIKAQAAVIDADRKFWRDNMDLLRKKSANLLLILKMLRKLELSD
jgi:hypothetical protein